MLRVFPLVVLVALSAGCGEDAGAGAGGGSSGGSAGGAGNPSGGSGGAAGAMLGMTAGNGGGAAGAGGATVKKAWGAVSLNVLAPEGCALPAGYVDFPLVPGGHPITATDKSGVVESDTRNEAEPANVRAACRWFGDGVDTSSGFSAAMQVTSAQSRSVNVGGTKAFVVGQPTMGNGVFSFPVDKQYMAPSCTITLSAMDPAKHSVWGSFQCESLVLFEGEGACALGESYFYFENCETKDDL